MFGLTPLGIAHTVISIMAVSLGAIALVRDQCIQSSNALGRYYIYCTAFVCISGFGIYQHGGFGKAHVLGIITLLVLCLAVIAGKIPKLFGRLSVYLETLGFSFTFLLHLIPGVTEFATRIPPGDPLAKSPDDAAIQRIIGGCFILFLVGAFLQIRQLRSYRQNR